MTAFDPHALAAPPGLPDPQELRRLGALAQLVVSHPRARSLATVEEALADVSAYVLEAERARRCYQRRLDELQRTATADAGAVSLVLQLVRLADGVLEDLRRLQEPLQVERFSLSR